MITDDQAEAAAAFLRDNAKKAGELRGERIYQEERRKHVKALLMNKSEAKSAVDREAQAYASSVYADTLETLRAAVVADEINRAEREGAVMRIEVWRTQSSNLRGRL